MHVYIYIYSSTVGAHIFGRLFVLQITLLNIENHAHFFSILHHMIDMIPSLKMLNIIIYKIHNPELDRAPKYT